MTATYDHVHIIHKLTAEFYQQIKFPFVQEYISEPQMDPLQMKLLLTLFEEAEVSTDTRYTVTLAALFIQAAMDTHDQIETAQTSSESERKQRQLTVLAGDYYSSLYYRLLAGAGETAYIRIISKAVQEINDAKMRARESDDEEAAVSHLVIAKSALISHLAGFLGVSESIPLIQQVYMIQLLTKDQERLFHAFSINKDRLAVFTNVQQEFDELFDLKKDQGRFQNVLREEALKMKTSSF